jgi:hypothetical protein
VIAYDTVLLHLRPTYFAEQLEPESERVNIAYTVWETDRVPDFWHEALARLDLVLVPSTFNERSIVESGISARVEVLPHIARRARPIYRAPDGFGEIAEEDFVFYTMGLWHNRKALPDTIRAYLHAFTARDKVALIVKTSAHDFAAVAAVHAGRPPSGGPGATTTW